MKTKTFTVKEANKMIPKLKETFDEILLSRKKIAIIKNEMDWIQEFWGNDLRDNDNPDKDRFFGLAQIINKEHAKIKERLEGLQKNGCIVKDISGLVDFYTIMDNKPAFLCWQYGESSIQFWHPIQDGKPRRHFGTMNN